MFISNISDDHHYFVECPKLIAPNILMVFNVYPDFEFNQTKRFHLNQMCNLLHSALRASLNTAYAIRWPDHNHNCYCIIIFSINLIA